MVTFKDINTVLKENDLGVVLKFNRKSQRWLFIESWGNVYRSPYLKIKHNLVANDIKRKGVIGIGVFKRDEDIPFSFFKESDKPINYKKILEIIKQKLADYRLKAI